MHFYFIAGLILPHAPCGRVDAYSQRGRRAVRAGIWIAACELSPLGRWVGSGFFVPRGLSRPGLRNHGLEAALLHPRAALLVDHPPGRKALGSSRCGASPRTSQCRTLKISGGPCRRCGADAFMRLRHGTASDKKFIVRSKNSNSLPRLRRVRDAVLRFSLRGRADSRTGHSVRREDCCHRGRVRCCRSAMPPGYPPGRNDPG